MRKIIKMLFLIFIGGRIWGEILIIDGIGDENINNKIKEVSKDKLVFIKPEDFKNSIDGYKLIILLGDRALEFYKKNNWDKPCVVGYVKNPIYEIPITGTGLRYGLPHTLLFTIISSSMKWVKRVGVIFPYEYSESNYVEELKRTSKTFNIDIKIVFVQGKQVKKAFSELSGIDLFLLLPCEFTLDENSARYFIEEFTNLKIPVFGFEKKHAVMGALMSYDIEKNYLIEFLNIIKLVSEGKDPSTIPVKYPQNYEIYIKKKTKDILKLEVDKLALKNVNEI
ncbi:MAG: ABC transporter substrate binding protein [candidate division WOR-3 bacterium]